MKNRRAAEPAPAKSKRKTARNALLGLACTVIVLSGGALADVVFQTEPYRTSEIEKIRPVRTAIVFGAGIRGNQPTPILRDRINAAVDLYRQGKVQKLLMSGDNRQVDHNEPDVMTRYAIRQGVPAAAIVQDFGGRTTYDTCYRARNIFRVRDAVLVTQNYHLPRALYISRGLGMNVQGYGVSDFDRYPSLRTAYLLREFGAIMKATLDVRVFRPKAAVLGTPQPGI